MQIFSSLLILDIGELYKGDLISIKIMLFCLPALLKGENEELSNEIDEEKVECFSKLMTVIGSSLERQSEAMKSAGKADAAQSLADCWRIVEVMAGKRKEKGPVVSNRIKFMLQDLLEMRSKGKKLYSLVIVFMIQLLMPVLHYFRLDNQKERRDSKNYC